MAKRIDTEGFPVYEGLWWTFALPQVILTLYLGLVIAACALAADRSSHPWEIVPFGLAAGWSTWTLFEYVLHRWLLHHTRNRVLRSIFWDFAHREHHAYPAMEDPHHHGVHCAMTLPIALVLLWGSATVDSAPVLLAFYGGWLFGYWSYEALHWMFHARSREGWIFRLVPFQGLYEAHVVHHLRHANRNYGFVTRFWDRAFGTDMEPAAPLDRPPAASQANY